MIRIAALYNTMSMRESSSDTVERREKCHNAVQKEKWHEKAQDSKACVFRDDDGSYSSI